MLYSGKMAMEFILLLITHITGVVGFQCAKYAKLFDRQPTYITCSFDCCGISSNRHCCTPVWIVLLFVGLGIVVVGGTVLTIYCLNKRSKRRTAEKHVTGYGVYPSIRGKPRSTLT